jgi:GLPGLI family protein
MRKVLSICCFSILAVLLGTGCAMAGKPFEGVITYKITYPDSKLSESQLAMYPKVLTVSIKGSKSRTDLQMGGMSTIEITDFSEKTSVSLINMMGQKYALKQTTAELESKISAEGEVTVEHSDETKTIAGYTCKKVTVTVNDDGAKSTYVAYYSPELGNKQANFNNPIYRDIDGGLLEFSMKNQEINMKFAATSVEKKSLPAKDFEIPSDYTITTREELESKFGRK